MRGRRIGSLAICELAEVPHVQFTGWAMTDVRTEAKRELIDSDRCEFTARWPKFTNSLQLTALLPHLGSSIGYPQQRSEIRHDDHRVNFRFKSCEHERSTCDYDKFDVVVLCSS